MFVRQGKRGRVFVAHQNIETVSYSTFNMYKENGQDAHPTRVRSLTIMLA
ncbi:MAG: hypothetical protein Fur006_27020 [Coleofasciculaceae cyanobacterium]